MVPSSADVQYTGSPYTEIDMDTLELRRRAIISAVKPEVDCGRFSIKRTTGESVKVEADVFADGHDTVACALLFKREGARAWEEVRMEAFPNDRWKAEFAVHDLGRYFYTLEAWIDLFQTWRRDLAKRVQAGQDVTVDLLIGAGWSRRSAGRSTGDDRDRLQGWPVCPARRTIRHTGNESPWVRRLLQPHAVSGSKPGHSLRKRADRGCRSAEGPLQFLVRILSPVLFGGARPPRNVSRCRDAAAVCGVHGFRRRLPPADPPDRNQLPQGQKQFAEAEPGDVGSPWAIGSEEGGHNAIHPALGTMADFDRFVRRPRPWAWTSPSTLPFSVLPTTLMFANIRPGSGTGPTAPSSMPRILRRNTRTFIRWISKPLTWQALWEELTSVVRFWIEQERSAFFGWIIRTPRPSRSGNSLITDIKRDIPDAIFLAEAFTRPR